MDHHRRRPTTPRPQPPQGRRTPADLLRHDFAEALTNWLSAAVAAADDAVRNAAHQGGGELVPMGVAELAELGASLDHLLTQLGTWTRRVAPQVADLPAGHELAEDTGTVAPAARCHQAADHLTQVSAHLAAAQAAAQSFHTAIAHLAQHDDED